MDNVHQHYENLKASTLSLTSAQQDPSVSLIRKNLVPQLRSTVVDFYNWQKRKVWKRRTYLLLLQFILPCCSFTFCVFFSPHLMWCCVMFCPDRTVWMKKRTAVRDHHPSRRWDSHFSVLPHVSCRFRWWITGSQKAVGVFQRCCNFLQRRLCWSAVFVCVPSAPKGQGSLLPSNRRRTDKQQRFVSVDTVFTDFYIYCDNLLFYICFFPQVSKSRRHRQVEVDFTSNEAPTLGRSRITKPSLKARTSENLHISGNLPVTTKNTTFPDLKHFTPVPALCAIPGLGHDIDKQEGLSLH